MKAKNYLLAKFSVFAVVFIAFLSMFNIHGKADKKSVACSGNCAGCSACGTQGTINSTYYQEKEPELLKTLNQYQKVFKNELKHKYSEEQIELISEETRKEFMDLIPQIPYIGGDDNSMTEDMELAAMVLAFYRVEKRSGEPVDYIGNTVIQAVKQEMERYPKWLMRLSGGKYFTKTYIKEQAKQAGQSQQKQYPGAWVTTFVKGTGRDFDYGFNHTECGIVKFFHEQKADELTPYLCKLDFVYSDVMDQGLVRSGTLAEGAKVCDFRFTRMENRKLDFLVYTTFSIIVVGLLFLVVLIIRTVISRRKRVSKKTGAI